MNNYDNYQISILDNGSHNNSYDVIKKFIKNKRRRNILLFKSVENLGFGNGHNYLYKLINNSLPSSCYHLVLNSDCIVSPNFFQILTKELTNIKKKFFFYSFSVFDNEKKEERSTFCFNKFWGFISKKECTSILGNKLYKFIYKDYPEGSAMLFNENFFKTYNGFDSSLFFYGEDLELSFRASKLNYEYYQFNCEVIHSPAKSTLEKNKTKNNFTTFHGLRSKLIIFHIYLNKRIFLFKSLLFLLMLLRTLKGELNTARIIFYLLTSDKSSLLKLKDI